MQTVACKLMKQSLIILLFFLTSCVNPFNDTQKVNKDNVDYVDIRKQFDTVSLHLTSDQAADFIDNWNSSSVKGPSKYFPDYILTIHFKGDSTLSYRTSGDLIKQRSDWSYSVGDKEYFKTIWFNRAGLADNYFEYFPTYFVNDKFSSDRNPLTEKHRNAIKQVLSFYKHKWTDIRGQVFYMDRIDSELLWNYTTKANDSTWLSLNK